MVNFSTRVKASVGADMVEGEKEEEEGRERKTDAKRRRRGGLKRKREERMDDNRSNGRNSHCVREGGGRVTVSSTTM
jgi:hypothetical protein